MVAEHAEAVLARARELSQVTPEERAELAEHAHQNRIDEIMNAPVQKEAPAMIRKVNEYGLQDIQVDNLADCPVLRSAKEKGARGERRNRAERVAIAAERAADIEMKIRNIIKGRSDRAALHGAIAYVLGEMMALAIQEAEYTDGLEDRIKELEKQAKPRIRIAATSTRTAA